MSTPRRSRRKVAAILASGAVVGVGAIVTLAAWNDSEFASGTFAAGTFNLEGSTDGTTYTSHNTSGTAASLTFSVTPSNMTPGDVYYAPFDVRLAANSTYNASVALQTPTSTGTVTNLTYRLVKLGGSDTCTSSGITGSSTDIVAAGTAITTASGSFNLTKGSPTSSPGTAADLCYVVTAGANLTQGQSGTVTWEFKGTSA